MSQLSVGVQTFDEGMLRGSLGRNISRENLVETMGRVMDAGFDYVNIDLMFSLPGQTLEMIRQDLDLACELGVQGISTYPLMLLPYTRLTNRLQKEAMEGGRSSDAPLQDPQTEREQYLGILELLRSRGYRMRTLWSFSTDPDAYEGPYEHSEFVGIGPRAWGMMGDKLTLNTPDIFDYVDRLEENFLPLFAYSAVKDYPLGRFARRLYRGRISKIEARVLAEEDAKVGRTVNLMRLLGLIKEDSGSLVLTDKALALGSAATKRIAMATLEKMNEAMRWTRSQEMRTGEGSLGTGSMISLGAE